MGLKIGTGCGIRATLSAGYGSAARLDRNALIGRILDSFEIEEGMIRIKILKVEG